MKPIIYDLNLKELTDLITESGKSAYLAKQIWQMLYRQSAEDPSEFSNLSEDLRQKLSDRFCFKPLSVDKDLKSADGQTNKFLFRLQDDRKIESVLIRYTSLRFPTINSDDRMTESVLKLERERNTVCISTQVGCPMNCAFCATGQMGFIRSLSAGEIVAQVLFVSRLLKSKGLKLGNIVVMGMGEPFYNYDAVMKAVDILCDPKGMGFSERKITISTVGIVPRIEQFTAEKHQVNLAVSLHAPSDAVRDQIIPANKKYPLDSLLEACRNYTEKTERRILFEYTLIHGLNDDNENAELLCRRLQGMPCQVNLIPLNDTKKYEGSGADQDRLQSFKSVLDKNGIPCTVRLKRGIDIDAGCGQLAAEQSS